MPRLWLPVREFAVPVPRTGSIETHSGYGRTSAEGIEIHQRVQARRSKAHDNYRPEVAISHVFERDGYEFEVSGRMDGIFDEDPARIEEIKSSFSAKELARKLGESEGLHPYCLQLRTYGYLHKLKSGVEPKLSFHLVSMRTSDWENLELDLDLDGYESWLDLRLEELVEEAKLSEERATRRREISSDFPFPFSAPRPGQSELISEIESGMAEKRRMLIQAPTGLGKTAGVLYPVLKEALGRGQKVIYVTPKNSQHAVAEDAVERFHVTGAPVRSLTITAKSKICFKAEPLCNPDYCEFAKDYYAKVDRARLVEHLSRKKKLTSRVFKKLGEEHEVCPFELQLDAARDADVVICDYNYVFAPRSAFGRISQSTLGQEGKPSLVIDEAHNLPSRAMDYYSPALSSVALERMRPDLLEIPPRFRLEAERLLDDCLTVIRDCAPPETHRPCRIDPPSEPFLEQEGALRAFLSRYLESNIEIKPRDAVLRLCFYWSEFTGALQYVTEPKRPEFFTSFQPHSTGGTVKITCCDASKMLESSYDEYEQVVGFSATLKPFEYYAGLSGLEDAELKTAEFSSPFPRGHRKLLLIPQISTKYSERERNYPRVAETVQRIAGLRAGNYFAFFPSFEFLERVLDRFTPPEGFAVYKQSRDMKPAEVEDILEQLRSRAEPTIVFAVQGGVFSEGVDYPGDTVIGAFVVGPPLPSFDLERETMREYYETTYGSGKGFDYAYTYSAMSKAIQAAGRVIRSETDRGLIVLIDNRFLMPSYYRSMPADWFEENPRELVSGAILKEVTEFWSHAPAAPSSPPRPRREEPEAPAPEPEQPQLL